MLVKFVFFYYFVSHGDSKWLHGVAVGIVEGSDHIIVIIDYVFFELHFLIINIRLSNFHIKINWQNEYKVKFFNINKIFINLLFTVFFFPSFTLNRPPFSATRSSHLSSDRYFLWISWSPSFSIYSFAFILSS